MGERVLVTGSSGFIGGNFIRRHGQDFTIATASLRSTSVEKIDFSSVDSVLHCAALVHQMQGAPESEYFKINYQLTKDLADHAKASGVKQFVFLSTAHVYGDSGNLYNHDERLLENSSCRANDPYGKSKIAAEDYLRSIESQTFKVAIIRPPMVYGKGAKGNILSLLKLVKMFPALPLNFKNNRRSIVFVGNLCQLLALVIQKQESGVFLPQDAKPLSISEIVSILAEAANKKVFLFLPPKFILMALFKLSPKTALRLFGTLAFDNSKTKEVLDYQPKYSTLDGFKNLVG
ncbi:NAD-dependent epimerase/dehydratase family protein [Bdellovibrio bacteriovorus]